VSRCVCTPVGQVEPLGLVEVELDGGNGLLVTTVVSHLQVELRTVECRLSQCFDEPEPGLPVIDAAPAMLSRRHGRDLLASGSGRGGGMIEHPPDAEPIERAGPVSPRHLLDSGGLAAAVAQGVV